MNTLRFAFVNFARDWKSGEQAVMAMALLVAVAALTAIAFFTNRIAQSVEQQAGEVLAADIRIGSQDPSSDQHEAEGRQLGLRVARVVSFPSVANHGERSALSAVSAVSSTYPLRGKIKLSRSLNGPVEEVDHGPALGEVWADARLLAQVDANVGDTLELGRGKFTIARVLVARPDQGSEFMAFAPTALFALDALPSTDLIQPGSRASYAQLFAGTPDAVAKFRAYLKTNRRPGDRVANIEDASPQLRESMDRAASFLNLASMSSVLLAAIAVAMAARRYAVRRLDTAALMKSMGATQARVLAIHLLQLGVIAVLASIVGALIGYAAQSGLAWILRDLISSELPAPGIEPALLGFAIAVTVLIGFALPPLLQLKRVPPVRVLRRDVEPPPLHYLLIYGLAMGAVVGVVAWILRDARMVRYIVYGLIATFVTLYGAGWILVRSLSIVRGRVGVSWRYGVANIARRGRESIVQIIAFGLGLMVLLLLVIVRNDLLDTWRRNLPTDAPNQFLINIQPAQVDKVREFFVAHGVAAPSLSPMASARMTAINDIALADWRTRFGIRENGNGNEAQRERDRQRFAAGRAANLSWSVDVPFGNKVVSGSWWSPNDGGGPRISMDVDYARNLGVKVGDRITFDVSGEAITAKIANLRSVQWDSFRPNFFVLFSPGVIDQAVGTYITSLHVAAEQRSVMRDFMRAFPEVTAIDIEAILTQVRSVMDKVSLAVQYVSLFTLLAGIAVLFAAIQSTRDERRYESAMLRTLGASRRVVLQGVAAEFAVLGILSGVLAAAGATLAGYLLAKGPLDLEYGFDPLVWTVGLIAGIALVGVTGTLATYSVVNAPPVDTLRRNT